MQIHRAWITIPDIELPTMALPPSIQFGDRVISFQLLRCAEADVLLKGHKPVRQDTSYVALFEYAGASTNGVLKSLTPGAIATIEQEDLDSASITAYCLDNPDEAKSAVTLDVRRSGPSGNAIALYPGNRVEVSPALVGKCVRVRVEYPVTIADSGEPLEEAMLHMVGEENDKFFYGATDAKIASTGDRLAISFGDVRWREV